MNDRQKLISLIRELSYREGDFTLASGKKSSFYIDVKSTTLHPEGAMMVGRLGFQMIRASGLEVDAVGGMTLGADPIATAVSLTAFQAGTEWPAFLVRKEPKKHGTGQYIEGVDNLPKGARVIILEDVVTTGGTSLVACDRVRAEGFNPVAVLTVVDREEGAEKTFEEHGMKFIRILTLAEIRSSS